MLDNRKLTALNKKVQKEIDAIFEKYQKELDKIVEEEETKAGGKIYLRMGSCWIRRGGKKDLYDNENKFLAQLNEMVHYPREIYEIGFNYPNND
jgi:hypothetical protein